MKTADIKKAFIECVYNGNRKAYFAWNRITENHFSMLEGTL